MALEFCINGAPPTLTEITAERERAAHDRAMLRKKNIRFLIIILTIVGTYIPSMIIFVIPHFEDPDLGIGAYFLPYLTFIIFAVGNNQHHKIIEKPRKIMDEAIAALEEASPEAFAEVTDAGRRYAKIAAYLEQVSAQGRPLLQAESAAVQQWIADEVRAATA
ncbi:MAG: hypothetical protein GXP10_03985 [Gammaproteobacteria bacterium]|nr:hypothetical protein [Gammaproteobacteria bacterium]